MEGFGFIELANGIRLIQKETTNTKIVHVGIMLDIGSRDELPEEQGMAHFWEHMAFKGTKKRNSFHILNRLESVGGELNAYTTKEKICFYASVLQEHLERAVELLIDITFNATFPKRQIEKEKMVILEEMAMYRDTHDDAIQDDFDELVFENHALGRNILGNHETVSSFTQADLIGFVRRNLNTSKIIFSVVGNCGSKKIARIADKYLKEIPYKNHTRQRSIFQPLGTREAMRVKPVSQVYVTLGNIAYPLKDERRITLFMLTNILGGPYMNSRLNMTLREKNGFVYAVEANYNAFFDTGLFSVFFAADLRNYKKSLQLTRKELEKLKKHTMSSGALDKAKQQIKGSLAMAEENNNTLMVVMAKSMLDMGKIPDINQMFKRIDAITPSELQAVAKDVFSEQLHSLVYTPES